MYALGVQDVDNVLMSLAVSLKMSLKEREVVTKLMMKGFVDKCKEGGTSVTGGQTIFNPWCIIGGVAMAICEEKDFVKDRSHCVEGDVMVLTKPLGTQVAVNAFQWLKESSKKKDPTAQNFEKLKISPKKVVRDYKVASASMARLNRTAAVNLKTFGAKTATDVTGFGLLGHLKALADLQKRNLMFEVEVLPCIGNTAKIDERSGEMFKLKSGLSAETSGGILAIFSSENAEKFCETVERKDGWPCWIIGKVKGNNRKEAKISREAKILAV